MQIMLSAVFLFAVFLGPSLAETVPLTVQERILHRIDQDLTRIQNELGSFDQELRKHHRKFSISPEAIKGELLASQHHLEDLRELIAKVSPEELPLVLTDVYLTTSGAYDWYLVEYLMELGELAITPFLARYEDSQIYDKEKILMFLGNLKTQQALPLVRSVLIDQNPRIAIAAIRALRLILGPQAKAELYALLEKSDDRDVIFHIFDGLILLEDPGWCGVFLSIAEQGTIPLAALTQIGPIESCTEKMTAQHLSSILQNIQIPQARSVAIRLISELKSRDYLKQLYPILPLILQQSFHVGGVAEGLTNRITNPEREHWPMPIEWPALIARIESQLTGDDIESWLQKDPQDPFTRIYLENVLAKKRGLPDPMNQKSFDFALEVRSSDDRIVCAAEKVLPLGQEVTLNCIAPNSTNAVYCMTLTLLWNQEKQGFHIEPIKIDFKPYGAVFSAHTPFEGSCRIKLVDQNAIGQRETFTWELRHRKSMGDGR